MTNSSEQEEALFDAARRLTHPGARRAFLDQACSGNPALRARIESLLAAETGADKIFSDIGWFKTQALASAAVSMERPSKGPRERREGIDESPCADIDPVVGELMLTEQPGARIGRYKLLQKLGEGGCGVVYMAEQEEPVRRRVALKVIKLGMDTKSVIARFEAERQALAMMDHPNIARVLDAGATEAGRPFFVMELVRGVRITDYCDQNHLDTKERLDLFIQICHAIQHAHQKGIIHRDIKPSNILVTLHDGVPVPKVIDFGIAKATQGRLTDRTMFTAYEQFVGTPAYMSPEQAEMSGLDVDTRSDIYSLGVLLYELLTGRTPFDGTKLMESGLDEMRRTLREREPQRPSTMLTTLEGPELRVTAERRQAEVLKLLTLLKGDLDWIVMKALEKDRRRRYETAYGLASDIARYLNNEPVEARPPSRLYRFRKLVERNRVTVTAAVAVVLALAAGMGTSTWLFIKEREARRRAVTAGEEAEHARANEARLRRQAETREKITQAALFFSQEKFDEADQLMGRVTLTQPTLEGAAVLRSLGQWHALHERWGRAADRFVALLRVDQLDGPDTASMDFLGCGAILAESNDTNDYARLCREAVARFAGTANAEVAERILKACFVLPGPENYRGKLDWLADIAMPGATARTGVSPPNRASFAVESAANVGPAPTDSWAGKVDSPMAAKIHAPELTGACSFDGWSVGVEFSGRMEAASATDAANYSVSGSTVTNVILSADGKLAALRLASRLVGPFTVTVNDVKDSSGTSIPVGSTVGNTVLNLKLIDLDSGQPFSAVYDGGLATFTAGGDNIWEREDHFVYACTPMSGDFDFRLRVRSIGPPLDNFTRVGLMTRDSLSCTGCDLMVAVNAQNTFQVLVRTTPGGETASLPPNPLPAANGSNSWVRLQRAGSVFHAYTSTNGVDWIQQYQFAAGSVGVEGSFSDPVYFGIATCAHNTNATATAVVSDFGLTPATPVSVALALMEYRREDYAKAVEYSQRCLAYPEYNASRIATARVILALACQRLHRSSEARLQLAQGRSLIARRFKKGLEAGTAAQGYWFDWVIARVLLREATELIEGPGQASL